MKNLCAVFLLIVLFGLACSKSKEPSKAVIDQTKFEPLYRAAKAIDASLSVSITLPDYRKGIQAMATEVSIAKDKAVAPEEQKLVELYSDTLSVYQDGLEIWDKKLELQAKYEFSKAIPCATEQITQIANRYNLNCIEWPGSSGIVVIPNDTLQYLWAVAGTRLRKANASYLSDAKFEDTADLTALKNALYEPVTREIEQVKEKKIKEIEQKQKEAQEFKEFEKAQEKRMKEIAENNLKRMKEEEEARYLRRDVYVDGDKGTVYHDKYNCTALPDGHRRGINITEAKAKGFTPCALCVKK
jgi:hypothetical protein